MTDRPTNKPTDRCGHWEVTHIRNKRKKKQDFYKRLEGKERKVKETIGMDIMEKMKKEEQVGKGKGYRLLKKIEKE